MIGAIFSAVSGAFKVLGIALGWMKQDSDQNIGKQLQAAADAQSTIKEAEDAQSIDSNVAGLSGSQLDDELRASAAHKS